MIIVFKSFHFPQDFYMKSNKSSCSKTKSARKLFVITNIKQNKGGIRKKKQKYAGLLSNVLCFIKKIFNGTIKIPRVAAKTSIIK